MQTEEVKSETKKLAVLPVTKKKKRRLENAMKLSDVEQRLQRIEAKLDLFLEKSAKQEADIGWLRAFVKGSVVALVTLTGGLLSVLLKLHN